MLIWLNDWRGAYDGPAESVFNVIMAKRVIIMCITGLLTIEDRFRKMVSNVLTECLSDGLQYCIRVCQVHSLKKAVIVEHYYGMQRIIQRRSLKVIDEWPDCYC